MQKLDNRGVTLALILAAIAGFVDAVAFTTIGGFFVSFMSGNSTRMAVSLAQGVSGEAGFAAGLIALFVAGVTIGNLVGNRTGRWRLPALLLLEAVLLLGAAALELRGLPFAAAPLMLLAMGCANAVFMADGQVRFGVTYMTGALARIGERLAASVDGGDVREVLPWLALWLALVGGAVWGAVATLRHGGIVLVGPGALLLLMAAVAAVLPKPTAGARRAS